MVFVDFVSGLTAPTALVESEFMGNPFHAWDARTSLVRMITQTCPECGAGAVTFGEYLSHPDLGPLEWTDKCTNDWCEWEHTGIEV